MRLTLRSKFTSNPTHRLTIISIIDNYPVFKFSMCWFYSAHNTCINDWTLTIPISWVKCISITISFAKFLYSSRPSIHRENFPKLRADACNRGLYRILYLLQPLKIEQLYQFTLFLIQFSAQKSSIFSHFYSVFPIYFSM